eukprot:8662961-Alexandrium_andersonii.AAC.1
MTATRGILVVAFVVVAASRLPSAFSQSFSTWPPPGEPGRVAFAELLERTSSRCFEWISRVAALLPW